ncbi:hypothetical protein KAFR_0K02600 [Kazachstania africana CBS 2517]|uniref:Uncharacterized protein n=1 Tax=Kazachstania africana (strain ATCC 22294 / BCRC 22015 / CBS 2517 / CECT 1963 / NBRC 1671 / NRRL Y-8276) TaxID=1071382 RepID=H2B1W6_KAZAF|nr:hypothetical protein KAFR_0K02600 [Kazachstania africana CBS 2517]CCF60616.1 hypothetical protein KAFR_0K02600 [Kazachstania africana CBS 2517]
MFCMSFSVRTTNLEKRPIDQESLVEKKTPSGIIKSIRGKQVAFSISTSAHCYSFSWTSLSRENFDLSIKSLIPSLLLELLIGGIVYDTKLGDKMGFFMSRKGLIAWFVVQVTVLVGLTVLLIHDKFPTLMLDLWVELLFISYPVLIIVNGVRKLSPGQDYVAATLLSLIIPMLSSGVMLLLE